MSEGKKFDTGKLRYDLIPLEALEGLADILTFGAQKYSENNWKDVERAEDRYYAALLRHLFASRKGEKSDPESGKSHLHHAITNLAFLIWKEAQCSS